jgi:glycine/D-amino acid oxidase-like deaminating enzyme
MGDASSPTPSLNQHPIRSTPPSPNPTQSFWQTSHPNNLTNHRSAPTLPAYADVVVIGTGITGTFAVHELLTRTTDLNILALEARTLCSGATGRNGGHLHPIVHSASLDILAFEMANFNHVADIIERECIDCDFRRVEGCLGFWNQEYFDDAKKAIETNSDPSTDYHDLVRVVEDPSELKALGLRSGAVGAIVQKVAASLSPYKLCVHLWQDMLDKYEVSRPDTTPVSTGESHISTVNLQTNTPALSLRKHPGDSTGAGWLINTSRGEISTPAVIFATNAYTSYLVPPLAPLIRAVQAQMSALVPPPPVRGTTPSLVPRSYGFEGVGNMDRVMSDYLVQNPYSPSAPNGGGHLMMGGGRHLCVNHGENNCDDSYVDERVEHYLRSLPERLDIQSITIDPNHNQILQDDRKVDRGPELLDIAASWTGVIGHSIDHHPWVGTIPTTPGLYICAGYTGHGMTNAPLCGRYIAGRVVEDLRDSTPERRSEGVKSGRGEFVESVMPREYLITKERISRLLGEMNAVWDDLFALA